MNRSTFEDLKAWQEAHKFVLLVYEITKFFPQEERFRLVDQLCRSVSSVPANLVEGRSRHSKKEYLQFVYQARGSLEESKYHLLLAKDLGYISTEQYSDLLLQADMTGKLINGLLIYLKGQINGVTLKPKNEEQRTNYER
jgi:four helix bundle protein